jgi:hypothetical protein
MLAAVGAEGTNANSSAAHSGLCVQPAGTPSRLHQLLGRKAPATPAAAPFATATHPERASAFAEAVSNIGRDTRVEQLKAQFVLPFVLAMEVRPDSKPGPSKHEEATHAAQPAQQGEAHDSLFSRAHYFTC